MPKEFEIDASIEANGCAERLLGEDDFGHIDSLLLDCRNGARKGGLVGSLIGMLNEDVRRSFIGDFNNIGLDGISTKVTFKNLNDKRCTLFELTSNGSVEGIAKHHDSQQGSTAHDHHHGRSLADVTHIIENLNIDERAANDSIGIYKILAQAEAKAHEALPKTVHFHEVGNDFAIASIVAFSILVNLIKPKHIVATPITTGFGFVDCAHGRVSIPAPATAKILNGVLESKEIQPMRQSSAAKNLYEIPNFAGNTEGELATPTGVAIVSYFAEDFPNATAQRSFFTEGDSFALGWGIDNEKFQPIGAFAIIDR